MNTTDIAYGKVEAWYCEHCGRYFKTEKDIKRHIEQIPKCDDLIDRYFDVSDFSELAYKEYIHVTDRDISDDAGVLATSISEFEEGKYCISSKEEYSYNIINSKEITKEEFEAFKAEALKEMK